MDKSNGRDVLYSSARESDDEGFHLVVDGIGDVEDLKVLVLVFKLPTWMIT